MDSWNAQLELAKSRIAEIEDKIALQRQRAEQPLLQNDSASLPIQLMSVLQESLARAKEYAQYIEQRIALHEADSGRRRARAALINVAQIECKNRRSPSSGESDRERNSNRRASDWRPRPGDLRLSYCCKADDRAT
jgi:hypothetical protein